MLWISKEKPKIVLMLLFFLFGNLPALIIVAGFLIDLLFGNFVSSIRNLMRIGGENIGISILVKVSFSSLLISNILYLFWLKKNKKNILISSFILILITYLAFILSITIRFG